MINRTYSRRIIWNTNFFSIWTLSSTNSRLLAFIGLFPDLAQDGANLFAVLLEKKVEKY